MSRDLSEAELKALGRTGVPLAQCRSFFVQATQARVSPAFFETASRDAFGEHSSHLDTLFLVSARVPPLRDRSRASAWTTNRRGAPCSCGAFTSVRRATGRSFG
jgi:hypothetical protein